MKLTKKLYEQLLANDVDHLERIWDDFEGITYEVERDEMSTKKRLFLDVDGVLATWQTKLKEDFVLPSGEVLVAGTPVTDELWNNPSTHYYASIPPYEDFVKYINEEVCTNKNVEVFLLSKSPSFAIKDKLFWFNKYLYNIEPDHIIICPYSENPKSNFIDKLTINDYLFDDYSPNQVEWYKAGGFPVNVLNGINNISKDFANLPNYDKDTIKAIFEEYILKEGNDKVWTLPEEKIYEDREDNLRE